MPKGIPLKFTRIHNELVDERGKSDSLRREIAELRQQLQNMNSRLETAQNDRSRWVDKATELQKQVTALHAALGVR